MPTQFPPSLPVTPAFVRAVWGRQSLPLYLRRSARRYGDLIRLRSNIWLASHPELARQILIENPTKWEKARGIEKTARFLGDGLLGSHGEKHRARRRLLQPLFAQARLASYEKNIVESALETRADWRDGAAIDINAQMSELTLKIVSRAVFGARLDEQTARIGRALDEGMRLFNGAMTPLGDFYERLPPIQKRFEAARGELDSVIFSLLAQRREEGAHGDDALSVLLRARDENGAPLPDEDMRDEAMTLLLAGHETTANALTFAWWFLGNDDAARARLDAELECVLNGRDATFADCEKLVWTRAILSETMRLLPPAWMIGRRAKENLELSFAGRCVEVAAGTTLFVSPFVMGRDPRFWENVRHFTPQRWLDGFAPVKWSYMPFGAGTRACLAEQFAWSEAILCLATLAQKFKTSRISPLDLEPSVTLRTRGALMMRLKSV